MTSAKSQKAAQEIYQKQKDLIDHDAECGTEWNKRVALTILYLATGSTSGTTPISHTRNFDHSSNQHHQSLSQEHQEGQRSHVDFSRREIAKQSACCPCASASTEQNSSLEVA